MRKIVPVLLCLVLAACFDQPVPPTAPDGHVPGVDSRAENTTPLVQHPEWRGYWRGDSLLWVYDVTAEVGVQSYKVIPEHFQAMESMGMRLARSTVFWSEYRSNGGCLPATCSLDNAYNAYLDLDDPAGPTRNIELVVGLVPHCGAADPCTQWIVQDTVKQVGRLAISRAQLFQQYADDLEALARKYPRVKYWQIWNEPDVGHAGIPWFAEFEEVCVGGGVIRRDLQAQRYRDLLEIVYNRLNSINDGHKRYVVVGGLAGGVGGIPQNGRDPAVPCGDATQEPAWEFIEAMYQAGAKPYFDILGFHAYGTAVDATWGAPNAVQTLVNRIAPYENGGQRPIWLTEFGSGAYNVTQAGELLDDNLRTEAGWKTYIDSEQERYMSEMFGFQQSTGLLHKMFWFQLDGPSGGEFYYPGPNGTVVASKSFAPIPGSVDADGVSNATDYGLQLYRMLPDGSKADFTRPRPAATWLMNRVSTASAASQIDASGGRTGRYNIPVYANIPRTQPFSYSEGAQSALDLEPLTVGTLEPVEIDFVTPLRYRVNQASTGWTGYAYNNHVVGSTSVDRDIQQLQVSRLTLPGVSNICYDVHSANYGWVGATQTACNGGTAGVSGNRVEAVRMTLSSNPTWSICYRVNGYDYGWTSWACNGTQAGTVGQGLPLNALQIRIYRKGSEPPQDATSGQPLNPPTGPTDPTDPTDPTGGCTDPSQIFC